MKTSPIFASYVHDFIILRSFFLCFHVIFNFQGESGYRFDDKTSDFCRVYNIPVDF